jgi:hypothetical protein
MKKNEKSFDCIAFKRAAQLQIYEEIKDMNREEQVAYFHNRAENGPFREWWLRQKSHEAHTLSCAENQEIYVTEDKMD